MLDVKYGFSFFCKFLFETHKYSVSANPGRPRMFVVRGEPSILLWSSHQKVNFNPPQISMKEIDYIELQLFSSCCWSADKRKLADPVLQLIVWYTLVSSYIRAC